MSQAKNILVTHAAEGVGPLTVSALAHGGHTVHAALDYSRGRDRACARRLQAQAHEQGIDIRTLDFRPQSSEKVSMAVEQIVRAHGDLDVLVHGGVPAMVGPTEGFKSEQVSSALDRYLTGAQRSMRAILPHMRQHRSGLIVWIVSTAAGGGAAPHLGWYCAIQSGLEALAVQYARELRASGIESAIVMPGMFGTLSSPFQHPEAPGDESACKPYEQRLGKGFRQRLKNAAGGLKHREEIPGAAAGAVAMIVETPAGERPFRTIVDPVHDGADVVFPVLDRVRAEMMRELGFGELLRKVLSPAA